MEFLYFANDGLLDVGCKSLAQVGGVEDWSVLCVKVENFYCLLIARHLGILSKEHYVDFEGIMFHESCLYFRNKDGSSIFEGCCCVQMLVVADDSGLYAAIESRVDVIPADSCQACTTYCREAEHALSYAV